MNGASGSSSAHRSRRAVPVRLIQPGDVRPRRPDPERVRRPPVLEALELDVDAELRLLDVPQPGLPGQLTEVSLAGSGERGLVPRGGIEVAHRRPERRQRPAVAGVVPHARRDHAAGPGHPRHLPQTRDRVRHEVDDQLRQRGVVRRVVEGQRLRRSQAHVDARQPGPHGIHERLGRVDSRHVVRTEQFDQDSGQRARPAADVQDSLARFEICDAHELLRERFGEPAHEGAVRRPGNVKTHLDRPFPHE